MKLSDKLRLSTRTGRFTTLSEDEEAAGWIEEAADLMDEMHDALVIFRNGDRRFQVGVGGNPHAVGKLFADVDEMLERAAGKER